MTIDTDDFDPVDVDVEVAEALRSTWHSYGTGSILAVQHDSRY